VVSLWVVYGGNSNVNSYLCRVVRSRSLCMKKKKGERQLGVKKQGQTSPGLPALLGRAVGNGVKGDLFIYLGKYRFEEVLKKAKPPN
jgi:hypothetical protein